MILFAILICLGIQRFANVGGLFQVSWFELYLKRLSPWLSKLDKHLAILLVIIPILLSLLLLKFIFMWHFSGFFYLVLSTAILFLCVDARSFKKRLKEYFASVEKKDVHAAATAVVGFIEDNASEDLPTLSRSVTKAIMLRSFEQIFVNLFWFMIFGVYGLVVYFMIVLIRNHSLKINPGYVEMVKLAEKIQDVMEWVPSRLLGFTFVLVGYFNRGFAYCMKYSLSGLDSIRNFVFESGAASLDLDVGAQADQGENIAAMDLVDRTVIVWLTALALVLVGMWF